MCIVHSTLRDATTPYTERSTQFEKHTQNTNSNFDFDFLQKGVKN
jgi:hypothetical protein